MRNKIILTIIIVIINILANISISIANITYKLRVKEEKGEGEGRKLGIRKGGRYWGALVSLGAPQRQHITPLDCHRNPLP